MATDLVLADQLPPGWLDDNEEDRYRLEVGDLVTLLSGALRKRWRFNLMTKKIELDGKPIPVFELENLYCHLSQRGYTPSTKTRRLMPPKQLQWRTSFTLSVNTWSVLRQTTASLPLILNR